MEIINFTTIRKEVIVEASQETSFNVFTRKMDLWWPKSHHAGKTPMTELVLEPAVNGRWFSRHEDGSEVVVGKVLEWDPYSLLILAWQLSGSYQYDPELITEVEVHFIPEDKNRTKVVFEHQNLDRLGNSAAAASMDEGWGYILDAYKNIVEQ